MVVGVALEERHGQAFGLGFAVVVGICLPFDDGFWMRLDPVGDISLVVVIRFDPRLGDAGMKVGPFGDEARLILCPQLLVSLLEPSNDVGPTGLPSRS